MMKFDKNIILKLDSMTFIIYIFLVHLYKGIIDIRDLICDPKVVSIAIGDRHFYHNKCYYKCESSSWRDHAYPL